jgi:hypothetical protein
MGGPGSGRRKGGGKGRSSAMQSAVSKRNWAKAGGSVVGKNAKSASMRLKKSRGTIAYLKKTGQ